jgi:hypothetical protein
MAPPFENKRRDEEEFLREARSYEEVLVRTPRGEMWDL